MLQDEREQSDWSLKVQSEIQKTKKEEFDKTYAIKLVERIVFSFVALILIAVAGALIALVVKTV